MTSSSIPPAASASMSRPDLDLATAGTSGAPGGAIMISDPAELARVTEAFAASVYAEVTGAYLEYRRQIFREEQPTTATNPPEHAQAQRSGVALLADNTLRAMPQSVKSAPILGGLLDHLEEVAELHSLSDAKCRALASLCSTLLAGVSGGLQAWFVEWAAATARNLSLVDQADYFFSFPWDGCLYQSPGELAKFELAIQNADYGEIERHIAHIGDRIIIALRDPMAAQERYAFLGEDGTSRRLIFELKTSAALMLGAYLISEEARSLLRPRKPKTEPVSAEARLPDIVTRR